MPAGPPPTMQQWTLVVLSDCWSDVIAAAIRDVSIDQDPPDDTSAIQAEGSLNLQAKARRGRFLQRQTSRRQKGPQKAGLA